MEFRSVKYRFLFLILVLAASIPIAAWAEPLDNWHTRSSITTDNSLWGVAYGNNTFVAVGDNSTVLTSPDGISWTQRNSGLAATNLLGVAFGDGKFMAVGTNGTIIASDTGETWVPKTSGFNSITLSGVAFGKNTFVVVGEAGTVLVSPNGDTWTKKALLDMTSQPFDTLLADVTFGNGVFVAVGYHDNIFTSSDGETWRHTSAPNCLFENRCSDDSRELTGVAYGNDMFVAVGAVPGTAISTGSVFISQRASLPAGESWTEIGFDPPNSYPPISLKGVAFGYNTFVAVGIAGAIYSSSDGLHWTNRISGNGQVLLRAAYANGVFTAVGSNATILQSDPVANLTVNKVGTGAGTVSANKGTILWSGDTGGALYDGSPTVTLDASAATGSTFTGWSGACSGTGTCTVTINAPTTVTAEFNLIKTQQFTLSVTKLGKGAGTVTSSLSGIACGSICSALYDVSSRITLSAQADASSTFNGWSGACTGTGTCSLTMDASKNVTAAFTSRWETLSAGWNFISFPKQPPDTAIEKALNDISPAVRIVWGYDNQTKTWLKYRGQGSGVGAQDTLTSIEAGKGYWIYMNSAGAVDLANWTAPLSTGIQVYDGWNLVGYSGVNGADVVTALTSVSDMWTIIWGWDIGQWSAKMSDNSVGVQGLPLSTMKQGKAYWIKTKSGQGNSPFTGGTFSSGNFKVTVTEGTMPTSINAISPQAKPESRVPDALPVLTHETNITAAAKAYTLNLAEKGFMTTASSAVSIEVPFDLSLVPDPTKISSLTLFVRLLNPLTYEVIPLHGQIVGNKIVVELKGFPATATAIAIFNPDMRGVVATEEVKSPSGVEPEETPRTWDAKHWYTVYDKKDVYTAVQKFLKTTGPITEAQIEQVVKAQIGENAVTAAKLYKNEGFRSPNICIAKTAGELGGDVLGTTPRYLIEYTTKKSSATSYLDASASTYLDARDVVDSDGNHYGRIFIEANAINETKDIDGFRVFGTIAHEMFHGIQNGYELYGNAVRGIKEGTATTYAETLDRRIYDDLLTPPSVRQIPGNPKAGPPSWIERETFLLSDYLMVYPKGTKPYSNQDFFVYASRKYGGNDYRWLDAFFEQVHTDLQLKVSKDLYNDPPFQSVLEAIDLFFAGNYQKTLKEVYLDFVRQRAMEHNDQSRFGRPNETVDGLATNLFATTAYASRSVDPLSVSPFTFAKDVNLNVLSTVALRITPTAAIPAGGTGATLTMTVTSKGGIIGDTLNGFIYYNTKTNPAALQGNNTFNNFGLSASDEIIILISNTSLEKQIDLTVEVTGQNGSNPQPSGGGCGTRSVFTVTGSTIPNLKTPTHYLTTNWGTSTLHVVRVGTNSSLEFSMFVLEMDMKASAVTGPGTYDVGDSGSNVSVVVLNENISNYFGIDSGTMNLTAFGTNDGDRMTGTFNIVVKDYNATPDLNTGYPQYNLSASFDLPWGCSEILNPNP